MKNFDIFCCFILQKIPYFGYALQNVTLMHCIRVKIFFLRSNLIRENLGDFRKCIFIFFELTKKFTMRASIPESRDFLRTNLPFFYISS